MIIGQLDSNPPVVINSQGQFHFAPVVGLLESCIVGERCPTVVHLVHTVPSIPVLDQRIAKYTVVLMLLFVGARPLHVWHHPICAEQLLLHTPLCPSVNSFVYKVVCCRST